MQTNKQIHANKNNNTKTKQRKTNEQKKIYSQMQTNKQTVIDTNTANKKGK